MRNIKTDKKVIKELFNLPSGYKRLQQQARKRDKYYSISPAFYEALIENGCFYCKKSLKDHKGSGVDRVDSKKHYTPDNVVGCCGNCNLAKRSMSVEVFLEWVESVYKNSSNVLSSIESIKNNKDSPWIGN
jgi:hypothetical protein